MRLKITYKPINGGLLLPIHYNYYIESLIYRTFSEQVALILHAKGFALGKRKFKLFTFSRILEKGEKVSGEKLRYLKTLFKVEDGFAFRSVRRDAFDEALFFGDKISFYFSSVKNFVTEDLGTRIMMLPHFKLIGQKILLSSLEVVREPEFFDNMIIKMLSPVTVYSTMKTEDGKRKTYYYSPREREFSELIKGNAVKKYIVTYGRHPIDDRLELYPYYFSEEKNRMVVYFKGIRIEGWTGIFRLAGNPELIKITYDAGLGARNPNGLGMWRLYRPRY